MSALARWCHRRRTTVVVVWLAVAAILGSAAMLVGADYDNGDAAKQTSTGTIVWQTNSATPATDPRVSGRIEPMLQEVSNQSGVTRIASPYDGAHAAQVSPEATTAYATVEFAADAPESAPENVREIVENSGIPGITLELGGQAFNAEISVSLLSEVVGVGAALIVLLLMFRSLWAAVLPIITGVSGVLTAMFATMLLSNLVTLPTETPTMGALIGLGVGIDYALFIVYRHRRGLMTGLTVRESITRAMDTSGRAVVFAGITVVIALLGMLVLGVQILSGMALGAALTVFLTVLAATTLLPAVVSLLGTRVLSKKQRQLLLNNEFEMDKDGRWSAWAHIVAARPKLIGAIAIVLLAVIAIPALDIRLGSADAGTEPESSSSRQAYDMLADGFGPGFNGPIVLTAEAPDEPARAALDRLVHELPSMQGVATVQLEPSTGDPSVSAMTVLSADSPQSEATSDLVERLRNNVLPDAERGTLLQVELGGVTAVNADFAADLSSKIPLLLAIISALGIVLLVLAFRSLLIPAIGAVMNLLTIAAAFGTIVLVFQHGVGIDLFGIGSPGPIEPVVPVLIAGVMFGLSMDYQVFLVSRMHEEWGQTRNNRNAVITGQSHTAPVLAVAAAIMFCVFAAFAGGGVRLIAEFGLGLAVAVLVDVFIVRMMLTPALMHLCGRANWWLPRSIDRALPHVSIEGNEPVQAQPVPRSTAAGSPSE